MNCIFQAGGALLPDSPTYIERQADYDALRAALNGDFLHIIAPRQIGKTSLLKRLARHLEERGWCCIYIDLSTLIGLKQSSWYAELGKWLAHFLTLDQIPSLSNQIELRHYLIYQALPKSSRIALFLDEVESVHKVREEDSNSFSDNFFMTLRNLYNQRDDYEGTLIVALAGATNPMDLVKDNSISPFNVGQEISLDDFTLLEARMLTERLADFVSSLNDTIHQHIYDWTSGHPYLTQRICSELEKIAYNDSLTMITPDYLNYIIDRTFLNLANPLQKDKNLRHVAKMLNSLSEPARKLWSRLVSKEIIWTTEVNEAVYSDLYLSGAIKIQAGRIVIRNLIYEKVFTSNAHTEPSSEKTISGASHEVTLASGIPKIGTTFLESSDRKRIVEIVNAVILGRSENGIRILLANCRVTESLINRINYNQGTRNTAEDIIGMLELSGSLNSPEYHALGAFLAELEKEVGHDAKHEISALIVKYNLMR